MPIKAINCSLMGVAEKFKTFCANLAISTDTRSTISTRCKAITRRLNLDFWNSDNDTIFSRYIGSYGRGTAISGFSDVDLAYQLHTSDYTRFDNYTYNGQSALLQEVKNSIAKTYPSTSLGADGIVVKVEFYDGIYFEVVPVFEKSDGSYVHPLTIGGGSWKIFNPVAEIKAIADKDTELNGNLKRLCKMSRSWARQWNVPIGGLLLDTLAYKFLSDYDNSTQSYLYYDYFTRDFFEYLSDQNEYQNYWYAPGSNQLVYRKGSFEHKAKRCYNIALEAIENEEKGYDWSANQKWREIYGTSFPG